MVLCSMEYSLVRIENSDHSLLADHAALDFPSLACGSIDEPVLETFFTLVDGIVAGKCRLEMVFDLLNGSEAFYISHQFYCHRRLFVACAIFSMETF